MEAGQRFQAGEARDDLLDGGYTCRFLQVHPAWHAEFVGAALWFHHWFDPERALSFLQCVWPDQNHHFPWDPEADDAFRRLQPILNRDPNTQRRSLHQPVVQGLFRADGMWTSRQSAPVWYSPMLPLTT